MVIYARKGTLGYGGDVGILVCDGFFPCPVGDVRNYKTFSFPVSYKMVKGATIDRLVYSPDPTLIENLIRAGEEFVKEGIKAITTDCGFFAMFQKQMAEVLPVPVFLSSLLQIPLIHRMLKRDQKIGIICANSDTLERKKHFEVVGVSDSTPLAILGCQNIKEFREGILKGRGYLDTEILERELVKNLKKFISENPDIGAILLECSNLPPYRSAIRKATNLPVFDFITLINWVHNGFSL